ncbi:MAG: hypothetical protein GKR89_09755 [Candidatus Latescibacteria bacterium]|nr:hypothetical protein [Candidatus Latescibacterota bacterium]
MSQQSYQAQVSARAQTVLEAVIERDNFSLWNAHALMALAPDPDRVTETVRRVLWGQHEGPAAELNGGPFDILPSMLLLCRWQDQLPEEATELIRAFMTGAHFERGNTENHWLMYYVGHLLAAERWPEQERTWNGLPPQALAAEARRWIVGTIERTARIGHHEYDSTGYHIEHTIAYIGLRDHTCDEELRQLVDKMLHILMADMALEYFHGAWAGGHAREGYRQNTWTGIGPIQTLQYLYLGGVDFDPVRHVQGFAVPALTSPYRPDPIFAQMAWDRDQAHVVKKTRAPRTINRHATGETKPVRKYTYMSPSFALGSTQLGLPGAPAGPIDLVSWDLTWNGPDHHAKIVCNHPYRSPRRFSAFLAGLPPVVGRGVGTDKPYLQWPDRLFGASPYEQMVQHEGALIVLYRIPADDTSPFVNLYLPKGPDWIEEDGWLLADMGAFHVALYPIAPYSWQEIREANNANIMVREGDLINGWLLRLDSLQSGLVLEAAEAERPFDEFCRARLASPPDLSGWPDKGRVAVDTLGGQHLEINYDGDHRLDGAAIDYSAYPLYQAPNAHADLHSGRLTFGQGAEALKVDFDIDPKTPLPPMRVIG